MSESQRAIQITEVGPDGARETVLVTADPTVVSATEAAVRRRVAQHLGIGTTYDVTELKRRARRVLGDGGQRQASR